ncbi:MAG: D-Ala-D-Ala carboxypeptidase family metallohydrolase [Bacteroidota bacterium]
MLASQYFTAQADLAGLQFEALSASAIYAGQEEGYEEATEAVDLAATLARIERHRTEAAKARPHPGARYEDAFVRFIDDLGYPNISGVEIAAPHKRVLRSGIANEIPRPWIALRLALVLRIDQEIRSRAGFPIRFNSLVRSKAYNRGIRGASRSQHLVGTARDRVLVGGSPRELARLDAEMQGKRILFTDDQLRVIERWRKAYSLGQPFSRGVWNVPFSARGVGWDGQGLTVLGGVGRYRSFVHADNRGVSASWRG